MCVCSLVAGTEDDLLDDVDKDILKVHEIDAYWLQRKVAGYFEDAMEAQKKAGEVLATMEAFEGRECENKIVMLLDAYDKFDFIKVLLKNQDRIVYCTKLARAQNDEERADIEEKMAADPKLEPILGELNKQSTKLEKDRALEERVRREARCVLNRSNRSILALKSRAWSVSEL